MKSSVTFVYVSGWCPLGEFAAFLNAYALLLRHLPLARVPLCMAHNGVVDRARRICERRFGSRSVAALDDAETGRVFAHFEARRRFEMRRFRTFTPQDLGQLRADLDRFSGRMYEDWYERWRVDGEAAVPPIEPVGADERMAPGVQFVPHVLPYRYPFTDRIEEAA